MQRRLCAGASEAQHAARFQVLACNLSLAALQHPHRQAAFGPCNHAAESAHGGPAGAEWQQPSCTAALKLGASDLPGHRSRAESQPSSWPGASGPL